MMKRLAVLTATVFALGLSAGCGGSESSTDWRDAVDCGRIKHVGTDELFAQDAWRCTTATSAYLVYEFADSEARDNWREVAEKFGARITDEGDNWLVTSLTEGMPEDVDNEPTQQAQDDVLQFGEKYYGRRGNIVVSDPEPWHSPGYPTGPGKRWMAVTIEVENISDKILDGYWMYNATADGRPVGVTEMNWNGTPAIMPGQTGSWRVKFKLPESETEVLFSVEYDMFEPIYWTRIVY